MVAQFGKKRFWDVYLASHTKFGGNRRRDRRAEDHSIQTRCSWVRYSVQYRLDFKIADRSKAHSSEKAQRQDQEKLSGSARIREGPDLVACRNGDWEDSIFQLVVFCLAVRDC